jgi:hypothetical protein
MPFVIGVDFDNTLVSYDSLMHRIAAEQGLINSSVPTNKRHIRDAIRELPDGELLWQKVQALAYGPRINESRLMEGVQSFFQDCRRHEIPVYIVSHKTKFASADPGGTNLREAALGWMERNGFFDPDVLGVAREDVYFEATRKQKIMRIVSVGCTHFIDDLAETFLEDGFSAEIKKLLFDPHGHQSAPPGIPILRDWKEIGRYFFAKPK